MYRSMPFLPALARRLLGEELELPAVTTWWCGQRAALAEVKADLDRFFRGGARVHGRCSPGVKGSR